jgi:toxin ParE1/3/4
MRLDWSPRAMLDLAQIRAYVAETDPGMAEVVASRILAAVEALALFPMIGRSGRVADTRELVVPRTPYLVMYRLGGDAVEIMRVFHGTQRWPDR